MVTAHEYTWNKGAIHSLATLCLSIALLCFDSMHFTMGDVVTQNPHLSNGFSLVPALSSSTLLICLMEHAASQAALYYVNDSSLLWEIPEPVTMNWGWEQCSNKAWPLLIYTPLYSHPSWPVGWPCKPRQCAWWPLSRTRWFPVKHRWVWGLCH